MKDKAAHVSRTSASAARLAHQTASALATHASAAQSAATNEASLVDWYCDVPHMAGVDHQTPSRRIVNIISVK